MKKGTKQGIGVRWSLFIYLAIFTAFVLLVVWIFQVLLLDRFYEKIKLDELNEAATKMSRCLTNPETLKAEAADILTDSMILSKVYAYDKKNNNDNAYLIMSQEFGGDYYLKHASSDELQTLYIAAVKNGGTYHLKKNVQSQNDDTRPEPTRSPKEIVYVQLVTYDNVVYIIMLNMIYTPLDSTVNTLNMQFVWIAAVLLFGAVVLSSIISYRIAIPLIRMNESAKKLAKGKYDADFGGDEYSFSYREARELADTLNYASEELSKADKIQKDLIANISHDLRTPLTMITGYSEAMRDIPGENTPENAQVIIDESKRLTELVNDLLDLSKIQSDTIRIEKKSFNITYAIRKTMQRYSTLTSRDGFNIEFFANEEVNIYADPTRMLQVVYNLINNAINYSGEDKIIRVYQTVVDGKVKIAIKDNGEGIAPENLSKIWDRYYKVDRVHKRAVAGTGLGLYIVKEILEEHNATYGVESELGNGSTFWFELPIKEKGKDDIEP